MNFERMLEKAKRLDGRTVSIAGAADVEVIRAVKLATDHGLSRFKLIGDARLVKTTGAAAPTTIAATLAPAKYIIDL